MTRKILMVSAILALAAAASHADRNETAEADKAAQEAALSRVEGEVVRIIGPEHRGNGTGLVLRTLFARLFELQEADKKLSLQVLRADRELKRDIRILRAAVKTPLAAKTDAEIVSAAEESLGGDYNDPESQYLDPIKAAAEAKQELEAERELVRRSAQEIQGKIDSLTAKLLEEGKGKGK